MPIIESYTSDQKTAAGGFVLAVPSGVQAGDVLVTIFSSRYDMIPANAVSAGWTQRFESNTNAPTVSIDHYVFTRVAGASEPDSYTFDFVSTGGSAFIGVMLRVSGADHSGIAINVVQTQVTTNSVTCSGYTPSGAALLVGTHTRHNPDAIPPTVTNGMTQMYFLASAVGSANNTDLAVHTKSVGAGATGDVTWTIGSALHQVATLLMIPAAAGGDPVAVNFTGTVPTLNGTEGESLSQSIASYFGGTETPFSYAVHAGTLPAGLSLNTSTGVISGTPTTPGTASGIVIRATDTDAATADTNAFDIVIAASSDVTPPVLTLPTGTATGTTTATGTVTTDEANGTLYAVVTASATPLSAADIRAGTGAVYATSQAVSTTGIQNVSATGLAVATLYYWHFLHDDAAANVSNIVTSASFTTDATPTLGWTTVPAVASVTTNSITVSATPNQPCDVFAVAIRKTQTAPLSADVVEGQDGDQLAAASANSASYTDTPVSFTLTGLTADPIYDVYVVAHIPV